MEVPVAAVSDISDSHIGLILLWLAAFPHKWRKCWITVRGSEHKDVNFFPPSITDPCLNFPG